MIHWARHCSHLHRPTQVGDAIADMHERQTAKATLQKNSVMYVARIAHLVHRATRKFKQIGERNLRSQLAIARIARDRERDKAAKEEEAKRQARAERYEALDKEPDDDINNDSTSGTARTCSR